MPTARPAPLAVLAALLIAVLLPLAPAVPAGSAEPRSERTLDRAAEKAPESRAEPDERPKAGKRSREPQRKTAPSFSRGSRRSERDPVRELEGRLRVLQQRVAELEAQVEALQDGAAGPALAARLEALEAALQIGSGGNVTLTAPGKVSIEASVVDLEASTVQTQAATATFDGVVTVRTLRAESVVADEMTPAAGNIW